MVMMVIDGDVLADRGLDGSSPALRPAQQRYAWCHLLCAMTKTCPSIPIIPITGLIPGPRMNRRKLRGLADRRQCFDGRDLLFTLDNPKVSEEAAPAIRTEMRCKIARML